MAATEPTIEQLLEEYDRALGHTESLWHDLEPDEVAWRPDEQSSAIGWHLGHQAAVAHFMLRNLTAAEARIDPDLEWLADSATPEPMRGELPPPERLHEFRRVVAARVRGRMEVIAAGETGAPAQMRVVGGVVLRALVNHEYQHDQWIAEVRATDLGRPIPRPPASPLLSTIDGYRVVR